MTRPSLQLPLLALLAFLSVACGAARPPRAPLRYDQASTSQIREEQRYPRPRALTESLHIDVDASEDAMAAELARQIDRATARCTVKKITHAPGSRVVDVDLGAGCKAGSGALRVTFTKVATGAEVDFRFTQFAHDGLMLTGAVATETEDGEVFSFDGTLPWKDLGDPYRSPPPSALASSGGGGIGFGSALVAADVLARVLAVIVLSF